MRLYRKARRSGLTDSGRESPARALVNQQGLASPVQYLRQSRLQRLLRVLGPSCFHEREDGTNTVPEAHPPVSENDTQKGHRQVESAYAGHRPGGTRKGLSDHGSEDWWWPAS